MAKLRAILLLRRPMKKILLLNGGKAFAHSAGQYNATLHQTAIETLTAAGFEVRTTEIDAGYDVPEINKHLDWIAVMTYDFHGHWDKKTGHVAPFEAHPSDDYDYFNTVSRRLTIATLA